MNLRRSSIGLHSFQGIFALLQKARLCNPCVRNELLPLSQEGQYPNLRLRFSGMRPVAGERATSSRRLARQSQPAQTATVTRTITAVVAVRAVKSNAKIQKLKLKSQFLLKT